MSAGGASPRSEGSATTSEPRWLGWVRRLQAIAQSGLAYSEEEFDRERYGELRDIAAEMMAAHADVDVGHVRLIFERETGYATPKVDVRGAVFNDEGEILLVRERADGLWTLPGGWADVQRSPAENVAKEVEEESGYEARAVKLVAVYDRSRHPHEPTFPYHTYKMFFVCELTGGEPRPTVEASNVAFFRETELPALSRARVLPEQIRKCFEHHRDPGAPTEFD